MSSVFSSRLIVLSFAFHSHVYVHGVTLFSAVIFLQDEPMDTDQSSTFLSSIQSEIAKYQLLIDEENQKLKRYKVSHTFLLQPLFYNCRKHLALFNCLFCFCPVCLISCTVINEWNMFPKEIKTYRLFNFLKRK